MTTHTTIRDVAHDDDFGAWLDDLLARVAEDGQPDRRCLVLSNEIGDWIGGLRWRLQGGVATLEDLAVVPEERAQGHAAALLQAFEARAEDAEAHLAEFWTDDAQVAHALGRRGWRPVLRRDGYIGRRAWTLLEKQLGLRF